MDHYFTDNRHLEKNRKEISFRFWCFTLRFLTDNGVFSKDNVDFGTRVLLDAITKEEQLGDEILDMGCGYGVIGITLKKCYPQASVTMAEVNPRAEELAIDNALLNQVEVNVFHSDVYENINGNTFSDIITNPPIRAGKEIVHKILAQAHDHLRVNGHLWVVIRKAQGAKSAVSKVEEVFGNCSIIKKEKGYYILKAQKIH